LVAVTAGRVVASAGIVGPALPWRWYHNAARAMGALESAKAPPDTVRNSARRRQSAQYAKNVGVLPALIPFSFFHWKAPFRGGAWPVNPWDYSQGDEWVSQKRYPVELKARASETFFLAEINVFQSELRKVFAGAGLFDWLRFLFLKARVVTDDGKIFDVKLDRAVRKEIRSTLRMASRSESAKSFQDRRAVPVVACDIVISCLHVPRSLRAPALVVPLSCPRSARSETCSIPRLH
jgi:hypothetical protein